MAHERRIVECSGPNDPHALDGISLQPRRGNLDAQCPVCSGRGQWNREIDLVSQRCKRTICPICEGHGWIETGSDLVSTHDIGLSPEGVPQWTVRLDLREGEEG